MASNEHVRALASTKFHAPHSARFVVDRRRLFALLDTATQRALTLVAAPAGAGKTVLLTSWLRSEGAPHDVAWLTLDETDNNASRFWMGLLTALRTAGRGAAGGVLSGLAPPPAPGGQVSADFLATVVNGLSELPGPLVAVLDDFHEIIDRDVLEGVDYLLEHGPDQFRLVISTRADPPLRLHRSRLAGDLTEIRAGDLAFTHAEAEALMAGHGLMLAPEQLTRLVSRTEGWAAGLRLAALPLQDAADPGRFIAEFAGDDGVVADYLLSEVLSRLPARSRDFLLRACTVERVCDELAVALTGEPRSPAILAELEHDNVFVSAVGTHPAWYRWHPLFAELARKELRWQAPQDVPRLHGVAARWLGQHGFPVAALRHAVIAGEWAYAVDLVGGCWLALLSRGELGTLRAALERLPLDMTNDNPELALAWAALHIDNGDPATAEAMTDAAELAAATLPQQRRRGCEVTLTCQRLHYERTLGRRGDARSAAERLLTEMDTTAMATAGAGSWLDPALRAMLRTSLALASVDQADLAAAESHLQAATDVADDAGLVYLRLSARPWLAALHARAGRFDVAADEANEVIEFAAKRGWEEHHSLAAAHWVVGQIHYLRDELPEALAHLERGAELVPESEVGTACLLAQCRAAVLRGRGEIAEARRILGRAHRQAARWGGPRWLANVLVAAEAEQRAAEGQLNSARELLLDLSHVNGADMYRTTNVILAELYLRLGDCAAARAAASPWLDHPDVSQAARVATAVLCAAASAGLAEDCQAKRMVEHALELAAPQRIRRPFVDCATFIADTLTAVVEEGTPHSTFALDVLERGTARSAGGGRLPRVPVAPLTERELQVLRYLRSHLPKAEIASELFVSENTIKTHVRSIYRKLGAGDRREALTAAHRMGLL